MKTITMPTRVFYQGSCKVKIKKSKVFWLFLSLFLSFSFMQSSFGQIVSQGATVKANFGIDADLYANYHNRTTGSDALGTDDWFANKDIDSLRVITLDDWPYWPGTGLNVISQTNAAALKASIQADNNYSFVKRMSKAKNTPVGSITWIDAVYVRDNNSIGGNKDASVFIGSSDKNGDNPTTWNLGSGGTPPKDDIIDAFGHMRMDGSGDVWGIGGLTKIANDGTAHADFEFFAGKLSISGGTLEGLGPDKGHTAWRFDSTGKVTTAGDLLVAVNFENGGTVPNFEVRVWISDAILADFNTLTDRPFDLIPGVFNSGVDAAGFGYAGITAKGGSLNPSVWAVVNIGATPILGAPWGALEGSRAEYSDDIHQFEFAEFAINLTTLGLEGIGGVGCDKVLGSLMIKTRSSQTFTSELKDFAGPFPFGYELTTDVVLTATDATCYGGNMSISAAVTGTPLSDIEIDINGGGYATVLATPVVFNGLTAGNHVVTVRRISDNTCMVTKDVTLTQPDALDLVLTPTNATCYGGAKSISAAITGTPLTDLEINIDGGAYANVTASPVVFSALTAANHVIILRRKSDITCMVTKDVTLTQPDALDLALNSLSIICEGATDGTISATVTGTPLTDLEINIDGGAYADVTASPVVFNGLSGGNHDIILRRKSDNTCMISKSIEVVEEPCGGPLCTYTQGYYGNSGGIACTPDGQFGTLALIQKSITNMGGTLYIGRGSNASATGGSFTIPYADAQTIIDIMPGGGSAAVLASDYNASSLPPLKNGRINNGLLSQTIALALNLYMADDLSESVGTFELVGGKYLVTVKRAKTSMCSDPVEADCLIELDAINSWWMPANVVNNLTILPGHTYKDVWSLFQLAKDALGGATLPAGVSLSDINKAVDAINNAFDGCRFFLRYSDTKEICPPLETIAPTISAKVAVAEEPVVIDSSVDFKVYPVPFGDVINVQYRFEYDTDVNIQVFNLQGGLIYGVVDNLYNNGEMATKQINLSRTFDQALIVRLITNKEKLNKNIVAKSSTQR